MHGRDSKDGSALDLLAVVWNDLWKWDAIARWQPDASRGSQLIPPGRVSLESSAAIECFLYQFRKWKPQWSRTFTSAFGCEKAALCGWIDWNGSSCSTRYGIRLRDVLPRRADVPARLHQQAAQVVSEACQCDQD